MVQISKWKVILVLAICGLGILLASPNLVAPEKVGNIPSWLPSKQMSLGLDLRGGAHLLIEAKVDEALKEGLQALQQGVRGALRRSPAIGYRGLGLIRNGITVTLRKEQDREEARQRFRIVSKKQAFNGKDLTEFCFRCQAKIQKD